VFWHADWLVWNKTHVSSSWSHFLSRRLVLVPASHVLEHGPSIQSLQSSQCISQIIWSIEKENDITEFNINNKNRSCDINTREYRRGNQKGQSRETGYIGYTKRRKTKQKHNKICIGHDYAQIKTNNVNKTCAILQKPGDEDEPNIILCGKRNGHHMWGTTYLSFWSEWSFGFPILINELHYFRYIFVAVGSHLTTLQRHMKW
jgi:hypothetical protein